MNYKFQDLFKENSPIHNDEYISNGYFVIKKSVLKKSHLNYINKFDKQEDKVKTMESILRNTSKEYIISEFKPTHISNYKDEYNVIVMNSDNESEVKSVKEEFYSLITKLNCKICIVNHNILKPMAIYSNNNECVGIVLSHRFTDEIKNNMNDYKVYVKQQTKIEEYKKLSKDTVKKCLYINDNKAVVRNKNLTCLSEITGDNSFDKLYVESDYIENFGEIYIDFGFIFMGVNKIIDKNDDMERIKYKCEHLKTITFETYKNYIEKCFDNMLFINVAEIKLMELAGESKEYINKLKEHRQNVLDIRDIRNKEEQLKHEQEDLEYVNQKNKIIEELVLEAEKAILNKQVVKNKTITVYKSRYDYNNTSLILYMMKLYGIKVPLKTQGWINEALGQVFYDENENGFKYKYYTSSKNSTVFYKYLFGLIDKINKKYSK